MENVYLLNLNTHSHKAIVNDALKTLGGWLLKSLAPPGLLFTTQSTWGNTVSYIFGNTKNILPSIIRLTTTYERVQQDQIGSFEKYSLLFISYGPY